MISQNLMSIHGKHSQKNRNIKEFPQTDKGSSKNTVNCEKLNWFYRRLGTK